MKLKICGLKYSDNIKQIAELNPEYLGFIFYEGSKRFVGEDFVMPLINENIKKVGVFVNASEAYILEKVSKYNLDFVQLHGEESVLFCEHISKSVDIIKAFGVDESFDYNSLNDYKKHCKFFLFDSKTESYEGARKPFDLSILNNYNGHPYFISGMDQQKLRNSLGSKLNIYGIDVNSRMEIKPGYKDIIKVIQIRNNIRS